MLGVLDVACQSMTEWPIPSQNSGYYNIALDGDDDVWFAEAAVFGPVPSKVGVLYR